MNNEKGHVYLAGLAYGHLGASTVALIAFKIAFMSIATACIWHIPAWEKAKDNHTEAIYQSQQMWPQQVFNRIPNTKITYKNGNSGNLPSGIQN